MAFEQEQRAALRILEGIEEGRLSGADSLALVEAADPALIYLIFTWLRKKYGPDNPASDGVLGRLVEISNRSSVADKLKEGQEDPVVEWFEDVYNYRDVGPEQFIELIVDKLEG